MSKDNFDSGLMRGTLLTLILASCLISAFPPKLITTDAQTDPFSARGGLADVNATVVIYPSVAQVTIRLSYFGGAETLEAEVLRFPSNFMFQSSSSSISSLNVEPTHTIIGNQSELVLNFSRPILSGERLELVVKGRFVFEEGISELKQHIWWNYSRIVGFQQIEFLIFDGINLLETDPSPAITKIEGDFLSLTWNEIVPSGFDVNFRALVTEEARNELLISPRNLAATITSQKSILTIQLGNVGLKGVWVNFTFPEFIESDTTTMEIKPFTIQTLQIRVSTSKNGYFEDHIVIHTNKTDEPLTIKLSITVNQPSSLNWFTTGILLMGISLLIGGGLLFYYRKQLEIPQDEKSEIKLDLSHLDERQVQVIQFIMENPGCSQQQIADSLGISKATVSREVSKLENLGYIKKVREGMSHKVFLNT